MDKKYSARIVISDSALPTIICAAMEAYVVDHGGLIKCFPKDRIETYGLLWGYVRYVDSTHGCPVVFVDSATVDTSAKRSRTSVLPKSEALELKIDLFNTFWPQLSLVGDFHSHPFDNQTEVRDARGWQFSDDDNAAISQMTFENQMDLAVQLVVTVSEMRKSGWMKPRYVEGFSAINFVIDNYKLWIKAGVAIPRKDDNGETTVYIYNDNVILECPRLLLAAKLYT